MTGLQITHLPGIHGLSDRNTNYLAYFGWVPKILRPVGLLFLFLPTQWALPLSISGCHCPPFAPDTGTGLLSCFWHFTQVPLVPISRSDSFLGTQKGLSFLHILASSCPLPISQLRFGGEGCLYIGHCWVFNLRPHWDLTLGILLCQCHCLHQLRWRGTEIHEWRLKQYGHLIIFHNA